MNSELSLNHVETQTMQTANADCADGAVTRRGGKRKHFYYFKTSSTLIKVKQENLTIWSVCSLHRLRFNMSCLSLKTLFEKSDQLKSVIRGQRALTTFLEIDWKDKLKHIRSLSPFFRVQASLHNMRFMSQARPTWQFARSAKRVRSARRGKELRAKCRVRLACLTCLMKRLLICRLRSRLLIKHIRKADKNRYN